MEDLRGQVAALDGLQTELRGEYAQARAAQRTGGTFETWLEDVLDHAAVAWVLGCVFVRFCEDNRLVEGLWLGGPEPEASVERAMQHRQAHLIAHPRNNDRDWLRQAFGYLRGLRATGRIFDAHNPVWRFDISGQAAEELSDFFRRGAGCVSLRSPGLDTRFLGDLYQDLSEHARKTYALLQTPEFVEDFILDRTFEPALREFGLAETKVIDPTCGSGHFLLGAFARLITLWRGREPATDVRELAQRALDQVTGVDINPFAVAITRFRLLIAALHACRLSSLEGAPAFELRLATGDSLLEWGEKSRHQGDLVALSEGRPEFAYFTEDGDLLREYLEPGTYTVVVGNPPYITVKDSARNKSYRDIYPTVCHRQYQLTVPFAKRFFDLAKRSDEIGEGAGWVGQITSNAFMKREFGTKLVNAFFAHQAEIAEVIDTSGAYIPGHGTPTVILVGRNRHVSPRYSGSVRMILGVRGEPSQPADPAKGLVWSAIVDQIDKPGSESDWVTATDVARDRLAAHPWSLSGGGASILSSLICSNASSRLSAYLADIGSGAVTREDGAYMVGRGVLRRRGVPTKHRRPFIEGEDVRDWEIRAPEEALWPYHQDTLEPILDPNARFLLWPLRRRLEERVAYGATQVARGLSWFEFSMFFGKRYRLPLSITFSDVATHNHFAFDRGVKVFNRHATVIKLPESASEDDHLRLLGVLNSSTGCFWLKQVNQDKGNGGIGGGIGDEGWEPRYEFTGTKLQEFPLPFEYPLELTWGIDDLARRLRAVSPAAVALEMFPTRTRLEAARTDWHSIRARMIASQEELDWEVYRLYGLIEDELTIDDPPELKLGERAFEVVLARKMAAGEVETQWFARHGSTPITELPEQWPAEYRALVEKRIAVIESDRNISLMERPECKRRWATDSWDAMQARALRDWLLDRLEAPALWSGAPVPLSVAQLADRIRHDEDFRSVLDLWVGHDQHDLVKTLGKLVADEHVPFLPAYRYRPSGLCKRVQWERTWALQRREDAGESVDIPVPPKYTSADFVKASYWRNRGKLDVPKERFVSYPKMGRDGDSTELLGWAGWDHLAQAQALATVYLDRKTQTAWPAERLLPLLAGLAELEPWLHQWYADPRPGFPGSPAEFFTGLIDTELSHLAADRATLTTLRGLDELP